MNEKTPDQSLLDLVGDRRQLGSVRQIELQDGAEKGLRVLSFSTGGGLDFWVLADRNMDIGLLSWRGMPVAWHHPEGFAAPWLHDRYGDDGTSIERALGGFLVTCGLENVRQPRNGAPLHGSFPMRPARISSFGEDWNGARKVLFAEGETTAAHINRPSFRMKRRVQADIGGSGFEIIDEVENIGIGPTEMKILYHINFGYPVVSQGTQALLNGNPIHVVEGGSTSDMECEPLVRCHPAGAGEFQVRLVQSAGEGRDGFSAAIEGPAGSLPYVQLWRDPRPRRNILSLEPSNCDRTESGASGKGAWLQPGEKWNAKLKFTFSGSDSRQKR